MATAFDDIAVEGRKTAFDDIPVARKTAFDDIVPATTMPAAEAADVARRLGIPGAERLQGDTITGPTPESMGEPMLRLSERVKTSMGQGILGAMSPLTAFLPPRVGKEVGESVGGMIEGMTSPSGAATLPAAVLAPEVVVPGMIKGGIEQGAKQTAEGKPIAGATTIAMTLPMAAGVSATGRGIGLSAVTESVKGAGLREVAKAVEEISSAVKPPPLPEIPLGTHRPEIVDPALSKLDEISFDKVYNQARDEVNRLEKQLDEGTVDKAKLARAQDIYSAADNERFRRNIEDVEPADLFNKLRREPNDTRSKLILEELNRQGVSETQLLKNVELKSPDEAEVFKGQLERIKGIATTSPPPPLPSGITRQGPGAASPAEFEPAKPFTTSIKNAVVDEERTARGLEPMMQAARQSNPASWDKAMQLIDEQPGIQDALIRALNDDKKVPGLEPVVQEALLLHRRIDLRNEFEKSARNLTEAFDQGDAARVEEGRITHARFEDMLDELERASKRSGTEFGRGLQFRRQMAAQDFSLAGMLSEARAARGGRRLTDTELVEIERLHNELARVQGEFDAHRAEQQAKVDAEVAAGGKAPKSGVPPLDQTALDKLAEVKQRQKAFKEANEKAKEETEQTPFEKAQNTFLKWRRFFILSGVRSLGKLASYSIQKMVGTPLEEGLQTAVAKLPGISKVAEKSATIGTNLSRELDSFKSGMTLGIDDAVQTYRTGNSKLDALYGQKLQVDPEWTGFFGRLHGAEKSPLKRVAFERSLAQRIDKAARDGIDVTDPAVQMRLGTEAYNDALSEILMNPNVVAKHVNAFIAGMEREGVPGKLFATTARTLLPIQRVPMNYVAWTWDYIAGLEIGSAKAARALLAEKGIEQLKPEEASLIMRQLTRGSIGTAAVLTGFLLPENFGGSFRPGVAREADDVKALSVRFADHDIPAYLVHNPLVYAMQFGATLRRVADSKLRKKDEEPQGMPPAMMAAMFGLAEETPYFREMIELTKFAEERTAGPAAGKLIKSLAVPLGVQWVAEQMDKGVPFSPSEESIPRKPENIWQQVETGLPGLRQNVPEKLEPKKKKR